MENLLVHSRSHTPPPCTNTHRYLGLSPRARSRNLIKLLASTSDPVVTPQDLETFDYSTTTAFQHHNLPRITLPTSHSPIEHLVKGPELHVAISGPILRAKVNAIPVLDCSSKTLRLEEQRRALTILSFVAHGYIWGNGETPVLDELPPQLAIPLQQLSNELGIAPLATYATTVLWNCSLKDETLGWTPENVFVEFTFTGTWDEVWFYAVSACVEAAGANAINNLISLASELRIRKVDPNLTLINELFLASRKSLAYMRSILSQTNRIDSQTFYWKMRPFFAGWTLVKPDGVHYSGVDPEGTTRHYLGISAAQSTLFQCLDILLCIEHEGPKAQFLRNIRPHMPAPHRMVLTRLQDSFQGTIKAAVRSFPEIREGYNTNLAELAAFRTCHLGLARKCAVKEASRPGMVGYGLAQGSTSGGGAIGAGGSELQPFLKGLIEGTKGSRVLN